MNAFRVASRFFESHYRNLVARMSPEEAKKILGFPPRSTLLLGLYAAAEAYEPKVKRATLRALVASMPLESVSILTGESMFNLFYSL